jgi:hypothetical protein
MYSTASLLRRSRREADNVYLVKRNGTVAQVNDFETLWELCLDWEPYEMIRFSRPDFRQHLDDGKRLRIGAVTVWCRRIEMRINNNSASRS